MARSTTLFVLLATLLMGCSSAPELRLYTEPASNTPSASLRVITNSGARIAPYQGCKSELAILAIAGRTHEDGRPSINHPSIPAQMPHLQMQPRVAPGMPRLGSLIRKGEGDYSEVVAEYQVPAGVPLLLQSDGAAANNAGTSYFACDPQRGVVQFESGKSYEMLAGMMEFQGEHRCTFLVYELKPDRPIRLIPGKASEQACPAS